MSCTYCSKYVLYLIFQKPSLDFYYLKNCIFISFLTLNFCLQYFHNNFQLLTKESWFDPNTDTPGTRGTTVGPADMVLCLRWSHKDFRSHSTNHSIFLGTHHMQIQVFSQPSWCKGKSCCQGFKKPSFVSGCIVGKPTVLNTGPFWASLSTIPGRGKGKCLIHIL